MDKNIMNEISAAINKQTICTENGAVGYTGSGSALVDFFYEISSMRGWDALRKRTKFAEAFTEHPELAMRMLFYARDVRGGLGERKLFRDIMLGLPGEIVARLLPIVPEYGRWDDLLAMLDHRSPVVRDAVYAIVRETWNNDLRDASAGRPVSLLGKWMPSIRKVSEKQVKLAKRLAKDCLSLKEKEYRKGLSLLRGAIKIVERDMSTNRWDKIDYDKVPSRANMIYRNAFLQHDRERREAFLSKVEGGDAGIHAATLYPYEIVTKYVRSPYEEDRALEALWKALPIPSGFLSNSIVVRDGSGSMGYRLRGSNTTALDVATALAILLSEQLKGPFANRFMTFSEHPRMVNLGGCGSLAEKIETANLEAECANTDIEKVFDLLLDAAVNNDIRQEEIPSVIIISDMEFDEARADNGVGDNKVLFERIREKWSAKGLQLPKLIFWNVCSRSGAFPMRQNDNVLLVSGFSQAIFDMLNQTGSMLEILEKKLRSGRYDPVARILGI